MIKNSLASVFVNQIEMLHFSWFRLEVVMLHLSSKEVTIGSKKKKIGFLSMKNSELKGVLCKGEEKWIYRWDLRENRCEWCWLWVTFSPFLFSFSFWFFEEQLHFHSFPKMASSSSQNNFDLNVVPDAQSEIWHPSFLSQKGHLTTNDSMMLDDAIVTSVAKCIITARDEKLLAEKTMLKPLMTPWYLVSRVLLQFQTCLTSACSREWSSSAKNSSFDFAAIVDRL
jgi:hypothetical protein